MKASTLSVLALGLMLALTCRLVSAADSPSVLSVRADEWYPVNGQPGAERPGFAIELLLAIFEPRGIRIDYRLSGWSRSLDLALAGEIDCVVGAYKPEAPDLVYPQTPIGYDDTAFYIRRDDPWRYTGVDSLQGRALGVIADYSYGEPVDSWLKDSQAASGVQVIHGLRPLERNVQKLLSGRLDAVVESPMVMESLLRQMQLTDQVLEGGRYNRPTPLYIGCSPARDTSTRYMREFDQGMARLRASGELERIMARYGLPVPEPADTGGTPSP